MSGGEQTRAALARLVVADMDLLMLDEPTNHLDVAAIEWLETALARRHGALIVASHDRAFLDNVVQRVWELRDRRLTAFRGNYSRLRRCSARSATRAAQGRGHAGRPIERERELVQRYRSHRKFTKMHEHERRLEALLETAGRGTRGAAKTCALPCSRRCGGGRRGGRARSPLARRSWSSAIAGKPVVRVGRLDARRGERIGMVGPERRGQDHAAAHDCRRAGAARRLAELGHGVLLGYLAQVRQAAMPGRDRARAL